MTKFNVDNIGHKEGYPLFLGKPLGILDTINVQYPELEQLYQDQLAQLWNEFEVDLGQDKLDMMTVDKGNVDLMVKTLMWQTVADSIASRSIIETLGEHISNSEMMNLATVWSFFEVIHARTYSHIIKQTFTDPNEILQEIYTNQEVMARSSKLITVFDALADSKDCSYEEVQDRIVQAIVALFALEAVAFMSSFATTFAIVDTDKFQGIGKLVQLICRDEILHARMGMTIIKILQKDDIWKGVLERNLLAIEDILDNLVDQEVKWSKYVFQDGRSVIGLNTELLTQYVYHMAYPVYTLLGITAGFNPVVKNPLPYMDKYIDPSKMQTANMELQNSSYLIGSIEDDTNDLDLSGF
tara:strand:- start:9066 stop:10130 length:1065 start_codon:yes stop_codon:yes gene_type:complete